MKYKFGMLILVMLMIVVSCTRAPTPTPSPIFTSVPDSQGPLHINSGGVAASAVVMPVHEAQLSFAQGGQVKIVQITDGEQVEAGQIIAQLEGNERLEAGVVAAETEILAAQQALDSLYKDIALSRAQAFQAVVDANQAVGEAKYHLYNYTVPHTLEGMNSMQALEKTKEKLDLARQAFEPYKFKSEYNDQRKDLKDALDRAQSDYNAALRWVQLESDLTIAQASLGKALQDQEILEQGPDPDAVTMAEARLKNAQAQLAVAQAALDQATLYARTAISVEIFPAEAVLPGQMVVTLADLRHLRVETSDLSERDVSKVSIGQPATAYIEALNLEVPGQVVSIARQANTIGGDVVYTVIIELEEQPQGLRWGMSAEVDILIE